MSRKIRVPLTSKGIAQAKRDLERYAQWIKERAQELDERLAVYGAHVATARFTTAWYDEDHRDVSIDVRPTDKGWAIVAEGEDVLFIEFGTGIYFNGTEPYPDPRPPGVAGIGEYGKGRGKQESWGYYDATGDVQITHGTPAAMPMWWASKEIQQHVVEIAREVFRS